MLCWSCGKELPDNAARCSYCEADVSSLPNEQEMMAAREFLAHMEPEVISELHELLTTSKDGEEFVNRLMVGDCPACDSSKTGNCEHDPDVDDITIGRCFDCGYMWCTICGSQYEPGQVACELCAEEDDEEVDWPQQEVSPLNRYHLLAAEIFCYSFANYQDHLGIGNIRFDVMMPNDAKMLEQALQEDWPLSRVAKELDLSEKLAKSYLRNCRDALLVIDAENAAESFRHAVRISIRRAVDAGLADEESIEDLVTQICYRAADLAVLLDMEDQPLSRYSQQLRQEPDSECDEGSCDLHDPDHNDIDDDFEDDDFEDEDADEA